MDSTLTTLLPDSKTNALKYFYDAYATFGLSGFSNANIPDLNYGGYGGYYDTVETYHGIKFDDDNND